jgi:hypothetical protein
MRIRHSLKAFVPFILMLAAGRSVEAQYCPPGPGMGMPAAGVPAGYGVYQPQSPYAAVFDQTYQSKGLWFNNSSNQPRDWYFGVELAKVRNSKMRGTVGATEVQDYYQQNDPLNNGIVDGLESYHYFDAGSTNLIQDVTNIGIRLKGGFWNADGSGLIMNGVLNNEDSSTFDARAQVEASRMRLEDSLRLRRLGGIDDGRPFSLGGRTDRDILENEILGPGTVFDSTNSRGFGVFGSTFDILDRSAMNLFGMPILNGDDFNVLNGETVPYDLDYILSHTVSSWGGGADWAFSPLYERGSFTMRPTFGGRYYRVNQAFQFYGAGMAMAYGLDSADADTPINAKVFPPGNGIDEDGDFIADTPDEPNDNVTGTDTEFVPLTGVSADYLIVRSHFKSTVATNLAGPQLGLQYELGDRDGLQLLGSSRAGLMFNREKLKLNGDNIGNYMGIEVVPDPVTGANIATRMFDTNNLNGPTQNAFADADSTTHLSPLFEQGINAQIPLFRRIPVLKDMWQFEDAHLNLGASWLWIGEVADPNQSIEYVSSPSTGKFLHLSPQRDSFSQTSLSVGINWNY